MSQLSVRGFRNQLADLYGQDDADRLITAAVGIVRGYEHWPWYARAFQKIRGLEGLSSQVIAVVGEILIAEQNGESRQQAEITAMKRVLKDLRSLYSNENRPGVYELEDLQGHSRTKHMLSAEDEYFRQHHSEAAPAEVTVAALYRLATPAQREVMDALGAGLRPAQVRDLLGLSATTLVSQRMKWLRKKAKENGLHPGV